MPLYARIIGLDDNGSRVSNRIAPELFCAVVSEFARDAITGPQALHIMGELGAPLRESEIAEAQALLATITSLPTPQQKIARYLEIRDVLFLARLHPTGYSSPSFVKARLGV